MRLFLIQTHGLLQSSEVAQTPVSASEDTGRAVARALASPVESLVVDILRIFKTFSHQVTLSQIQRFDWIALSGETSHLPGLAPWLQARIGVPVDLIDPFSPFPMLESIAKERPWADLEPQFSIAMGLALRDVERKP